MKRSERYAEKARNCYWTAAFIHSLVIFAACWVPFAHEAGTTYSGLMVTASVTCLVIGCNILADGRYWSRRARWQAQDEQRAAIRPRI